MRVDDAAGKCLSDIDGRLIGILMNQAKRVAYALACTYCPPYLLLAPHALLAPPPLLLVWPSKKTLAASCDAI
jgi:hypothetical protein